MSLDVLRQPERIAIGKLRTDGGTQPRAGLDQAVVAEYAELFAENSWPFPPVVAFYDGTEYWLADGFHRIAAAQLRMARWGSALMPVVDVRQGERRDAILYSVGANSEHGLRRTNEDKRRAVTRLLEDAEWSQWSDREIGRRARVSPMFVGNLRKELSVNGLQMGDTQRTAMRNGVAYTIETGKIGKGASGPDSARQGGKNNTDRMLEDIDERLSEEAAEMAIFDGKLVVDWTDEDWEAYTKGRRPPDQQATADAGRPTAAICQHCHSRKANVAGKPYCDVCWHKELTDGLYCPHCQAHSTLPKQMGKYNAAQCWSCKIYTLKTLWLTNRVTKTTWGEAQEAAVPQTTAAGVMNHAPTDAPTDDKNALSAEGRDEVTPVQWSPDPDNAKELQRLGSLYATLGHVVRLLGFGEDGETAEGYGFGVEFQRLLTEAGGLREEVRKLTPKDRVNG